MTETVKNISDPARDYVHTLALFSQAKGKTVADRIAEASRVTVWSGEFYHSVKLFQDTLGTIHQTLMDDEFLDEDDDRHLRGEIDRLRGLYSTGWMTTDWARASSSGSPAGPESITFLKSA